MSFHYKAHNDFYNYLCDDYRTHTTPVKKDTNVKELTLQDLDDGVIVVMPDNSKYQVRRTNLVLDVSEWSGVLDRLHIALEGRPQPIIREQEKNIMKKDFTKADLRSGHKVVFRSGETFVVFLNVQDKNSNVLSGEESWLDFSHINDDLTATFSTDCDIVEVWNNPVYDLTSDRKYNLVWKREEKSPEQLAYEQLQAQIADEEARHNESMKALREQAEKLKPKQ